MSQYKTGTVTVTNGSATVTGSGTSWSANVAAGDLFTIIGSSVPYIVGSVGSDTSLTLTSTYAGVTASAQSYAITTSFTPILGIPYMEQGDLDTATIYKRGMLVIEDFLNTTSFVNLTITGNTTIGDASGDTLTINAGTTTFSQGTANGVLYLNGSKVATSGSALTFDGSKLLVGSNTAGYGTLNVARDATTPYASLTVTDEANANNTVGVYLRQAGSSPAGISTAGAPLAFFLGGAGSTEGMRLTSTGLGIGTTSPGYKLQVTTASSGAVSRWNYTGGSRGARIEFGLGENGSGAENYIDFSGTSGTSEGVFKASGAEVMRINSSGNLGLGVTPSAWGSSFKSFDVPYGSLMGAATSINMPGNAYHNGTSWTYRSTAASSNYQQGAGVHSWYTAASGTAGNAITFTQAATLTSAGDYLVGKTALAYNTVGCAFEALGTVSATRSADFSGVFNRTTSDGGIIQFRRDNTAVGSISVTTSATAYNTSSDYRLKNIDGPLTGSGAFIDALKPKVGTWKADGSKFVGFLAHEVQEVSPASVVGEKDGEEMQAMEYGSAEFIANIIAELQSLRARVAALES